MGIWRKKLLINIDNMASGEKGLLTSNNKTKVMVVSNKLETPQCRAMLYKKNLTDQLQQFSYLGSALDQDSKYDNKMKKRNIPAIKAYEKKCV